MAPRADVSLLYDLFVTSQRVRRVLSDGLAGSGMRPDEYAVYSLLFDYGPLTATEMAEFLGMPFTTLLDYLKAMGAAGHLDRIPHPTDGRALQLSLSRTGKAAHRRAHAHWEVVRKRIEDGLQMPIPMIRIALQALDDAADQAGSPTRKPRSRLGRSDSVGGILSSVRKSGPHKSVGVRSGRRGARHHQVTPH